MVWFSVPLKYGSFVCLFSIFIKALERTNKNIWKRITGTSGPTQTKQEYKFLVKLSSILLLLEGLPFTLSSCLNTVTRKRIVWKHGTWLSKENFLLIWMKQRCYGSIYKEMELEMDCPTPSILLQKVCSYKYQFCTKVCSSSSLVSQVHMMARQNINKKYLMCQIPIKMVKQQAFSNSSLHNLKINSSKRCRKTSQSWINSTYS